jgi:hypothetical protein
MGVKRRGIGECLLGQVPANTASQAEASSYKWGGSWRANPLFEIKK